DHERARRGAVPGLLGHERARGLEPRDVAQLALPAVARVAREEATTAQRGLGAAQGDEATRELEQAPPGLVELPVDPRDLVVLAVAVVVAMLGAADLVSVGDHRHTLGDEERREEVALLARAQREHALVVRGALGPAV